MKKRRLKTLSDVRRWLADVANRLERGEVNEGFARCAGYLSSIMSQIIQHGDLEQRVNQLEKRINDESEKQN